MDTAGPKFRLRAESAFRRSAEEMDTLMCAMLGGHSAKGRLQSGATIKAALEIFEEHSKRALDQTLSEAGKLIEHRRRNWASAMNGIGEALADHLSRAREYLEKPRQLADSGKSPSVTQAIDERLAGINDRLQSRLSEFREGWTAPVPKLWKDRHPLPYQIILLVIGAVVALAVSYSTGLLRIGPGSD